MKKITNSLYRLFPAMFLFLFLQSFSYAETSGEKPVRVLIVTGVDYPGHAWRTQSLELRKALAASRHIDVRLSEDVEVLGTELIFDYDVLLLNFKNYDPLKRETAARENLVRFITEGGGLMYFHFTGGAFENWPEYRQIAGRVWNPKLRGHDPFQKFSVQIVQKDHPVAAGVGPFQIWDELYTCMEGEREIEVIAEAKSTVDGKNYPMAFVFTEGKGRAFHTVLGHDAKAFAAPELTLLLQNAALWCAKREGTSRRFQKRLKNITENTFQERLLEISSDLPEGAKLAAYLDCGGSNQLEAGLNISVANNSQPYEFPVDPELENVWPSQTTVLFDPEQVSFRIDNMDRTKKYRLNLVCWDFDANGRSQSVLAKTPDGMTLKILRPAFSLPNYAHSKQTPQVLSLPLPTQFVRDGKMLLNLKNESGPNAVVNEIWIEELP